MIPLGDLQSILDMFASVWEGLTALVSVVAAAIYAVTRYKNKKLAWLGLALLLVSCSAITVYLLYGIERDKEPIGLTEVTFGSKDFLESSILAEMVAYHVAKNYPRIRVKRRYGLGDTKFLQSFLRDKDIDLYPEYTGTALAELTNIGPERAKDSAIHTNEFLNERFQEAERTKQLHALELFGFRNNHVLVMRKARYKDLCSVLMVECEPTMTWFSFASRYRDIVVGSANEFFHRQDGLPFLQKVYTLGLVTFQVVQHEKKYDELAAGEIDAIIGYTTDPELLDDSVIALDDDRGGWPDYYAFPLANAYLVEGLPGLAENLRPLARTIGEVDIQRLIRDAQEAGITTEELARGRTHDLQKLVQEFFERRTAKKAGGN